MVMFSKFKEALQLYRTKKIRAVPIKIFDVSKITEAYRYFSGKNRMGKVVISVQDPMSVVRVRSQAPLFKR